MLNGFSGERWKHLSWGKRIPSSSSALLNFVQPTRHRATEVWGDSPDSQNNAAGVTNRRMGVHVCGQAEQGALRPALESRASLGRIVGWWWGVQRERREAAPGAPREILFLTSMPHAGSPHTCSLLTLIHGASGRSSSAPVLP